MATLPMRGTSLIGLLVALTSIAHLLQGCGANVEKTVDKTIVDSSIKNTLYFDLDETPRISAALVVSPSSVQPELRMAVLPFSTRRIADVTSNLLTTWGSHEGITLITYIAAPSLPSIAVIPIGPIFDTAEDSDFTRTDLQGSLYFMSSGLKRRFFYQWPQANNRSPDSWNRLRKIGQTSIDSVLIKLPTKAEVFERGGSSLAPLIERVAQSGRLKIYPHTKPNASVLSAIDITYQVPPTKNQGLVFEYTLKLFGALVVPLISLLLLSSDKVKAKRFRIVVLVIGITLEAVILVGLLWWAFNVQSVAGMAAMLDLGLVVIGAGLTVLLTLVKGDG